MVKMSDLKSKTWKKLAEIECDTGSPNRICEAIAEAMGCSMSDAASMIKDGWAEICEDGIVIWADMH